MLPCSRILYALHDFLTLTHSPASRSATASRGTVQFLHSGLSARQDGRDQLTAQRNCPTPTRPGHLPTQSMRPQHPRRPAHLTRPPPVHTRKHRPLGAQVAPNVTVA